MRRLAILGASGHGKVTAEIAELCGWSDIDFFDDAWPSVYSIGVWEVVGNTDQLMTCIREYDAFFIAIGNNVIRSDKFMQLSNLGVNAALLVHPSSAVSKYASLGEGTVVMANAVVNPFATIGNACIINSSSVIEHDCILSDGSHISPGAHLAGAVNIGKRSWVGIGANVIQQINIADDVIVGAGSTVINDQQSNTTVVGSPAKPTSIK
jgi:sugar O-acyltransferase (sialic acid O-acetyltransferase NeuD family)